MTSVSRRAFVGASTLGAAAVLAGCDLVQTTNGVTTINLAPLESDAALVIGGVSAIAAALPSAVASGVTNAVADANGVLTTIKSTVGSTVALTTGTGWVQSVVSDAESVLNVATTVGGLPASVTQYIPAVEALLPVLQTLVGILVAGAKPGAMSADQARAVLAAVKK